MKQNILQRAKEDIPLYFNDFKSFWDNSINEISNEDLIEIYRATLVFKNWKISFHSIKIKDFDLVIDELYEDINSSFFLAIYGLYRSAHMHMRSSIELAMQLLYFLHHPIEYHNWKNGNFIIKQGKIAEYLISHPNFDVDVKTLIENITRIWKYFSKHIHGESPIFFQCEKDVRKTNSFSKKDFGIWKTNYLENIYYLNKLFLLFFKNKLNRIPHVSRRILTSLMNTDDLKLIEIL